MKSKLCDRTKGHDNHLSASVHAAHACRSAVRRACAKDNTENDTKQCAHFCTRGCKRIVYRKCAECVRVRDGVVRARTDVTAQTRVVAAAVVIVYTVQAR